MLGAAVLRQALWLYGSERLPLFLVTEFPKSGGSWVCQLLSAYLQLPYPRNVRPRIESSVLHGHMLYHRRHRNVTVVLRDGRDVMVSAYYHYLQRTDRNLGVDVDFSRGDMVERRHGQGVGGMPVDSWAGGNSPASRRGAHRGA